MENSLYLLLGFAEAAEKYKAANKDESLDGLENIDLPYLKKYLADSIGSFDIENAKESSKIGQLVFEQFLKEKKKTNKKNVIEELGQIFDVDFDSVISQEKQAKLKIDDLLANYETEYEEEAPQKEETKEEVTEDTKEVIEASDKLEETPVVEDTNFETVIDDIIGIKETDQEKVDEDTVFFATKKIDEEEKDVTSEVLVEIAADSVGEFEVLEEDFDTNKEVIDEIKDVFENLNEEDNHTIIIEQEENDFGIDENDEILKAIRKAAGFDCVEEETKTETPIFQPAPDELDSLFEEVELSSKQSEEIETEEVDPYSQMSSEDYLKSLSGLINYGQFDELLKEDEEETEEAPVEYVEAPREFRYIINPLIDEQAEEVVEEEKEEVQQEDDEHYVLADEQDVVIQNPVFDIPAQMDDSYSVTSEELALHFIENPGLDVVFNGDDIVYSSYVEDQKEAEEINDEVQEEVKEVQEEPVEELKEENETEVVLEEKDENEEYIDSLLNDYEYGNSKVDEILNAKEEVYKIISKMYPYLNYAFIKSAYDLKDSIADEYEEDEELIILHRALFKEVDDLRKYAELMMSHDYQVNVDENQMIVDTLKSYVNADGLILNSIFEVANQVNLINGEYEGYCVLTNDEK